jgi:predicted RNA-binding protein with PUA-like domain
MGGPIQYWLMKSEPGVYSIDDLARDGKTYWDGVRNYRARNFMRDDMKIGDWVLYYHSNADPSGVAGIAKVCKTAYPDFTSRDPLSKYYDPKSSEENPIWFMVDLEFVEKFPNFVSLQELKTNSDLDGLMVIRRGMRLSIQPVDSRHFEIIRGMGNGN